MAGHLLFALCNINVIVHSIQSLGDMLAKLNKASLLPSIKDKRKLLLSQLTPLWFLLVPCPNNPKDC
jgi:hypothetical protein